MKNWLLMVTLLLSGCLGLGKNTPEVVNYVLEDLSTVTEKVATPDLRSLLILDTTATAFYDNENLVYSRALGTRGQYQYARWTERPGKRFSDLLQKRLATQSGFSSVSVAGGQVRGDLVLDTELSEFYHEAAATPGSVHVQLRAELIDLKTRKLLSRQWFERRVPVGSYDAAGAAKGFNQATTGVLDDVVAWLATTPKQVIEVVPQKPPILK